MIVMGVLLWLSAFGQAPLRVVGRPAEIAPSSHAAVRTPDYWPTNAWRESRPEEQGLDPSLLRLADAHIEKDLPGFRSLLVVRHGSIVFERYYRGCSRDVEQDMASATKGVLSALIGIAIGDGYLRSEEQRLPEFFPSFFSHERDPRKRRIALCHLLTMTSGLALDFRTTVGAMEPSSDWTEFILSRPMADDPGARFLYSGASHLLSVILAHATGMSTREFAERRLFQPLGIKAGEWPKDPQGYEDGTHGLHLTARDMAKIGYLYLHNGVWDHRQIVLAAWVRESAASQNAGGFPGNTAYGYFWWVSDETGHAAYFAAGYGGQSIYVIPDLDMVVVMTGNSNLPPMQLSDHRHVIRQFLVPAVRDDNRR
jgi:CubicO group peptidase (beta-lactamase class C family)